jgi:hypothetical protein
MPIRSIGNTNVGIYSPLSLLIDTSAPYSLDYVRQYTYPTQAQANANVGDYAQAAGQSLAQLKIKCNFAGRGTAEFTYPWSQSTTGATYIGTDKQIYTYTYTYFTINATATYPYVFSAWLNDNNGSSGGIFSYGSTVNVDPGVNAVTQEGWGLIAQFI